MLSLNLLKTGIRMQEILREYNLYYVYSGANRDVPKKRIEENLNRLLAEINGLKRTGACMAAAASAGPQALLVMTDVQGSSQVRHILRGYLQPFCIEEPFAFHRPNAGNGALITGMLNALAKILFLQDLPQDAVFTRGYGVPFFQPKGIMVNVYFSDYDYEKGLVKINAKNINMKKVSKPDPELHWAVDGKTGLMHIFGQEETRYTKRVGKTGVKKAVQHAFANNGEEWFRTRAVSACMVRVMQKLEGSGFCRFEPVAVACAGPGFAIASNVSKKTARQLEQMQLENTIEMERAGSADIIATDGGVSGFSLEYAEKYAGLRFSEPYIVPIPEGWEGCRIRLASSIPVLVDFCSGKSKTAGLAMDRSYKLWENRANKDGGYARCSRTEVYVLPRTGSPVIHVDCVDEYGEISDRVSLALTDAEADRSRAVSVIKRGNHGRQHLVIQADKKDRGYIPGLDRQHIQEPEILGCRSFHAGKILLQTARKELLLTKGDLLDMRLRSVPAGWGWSCTWHKTAAQSRSDNTGMAERAEVRNLEMAVSMDGTISISERRYLVLADLDQSEQIRQNYDYWVLVSPHGKKYVIQPSTLKQILFDDGHSAYNRSHKNTGVLFDNVLSNTSYRHFRYDNGDYYLVGWDDSDNWQSSYQYLPHIYQVFSESGVLADREWEDLFRLCDVGFVRSSSDSTVLPVFAKYLREYDRVMHPDEREKEV